MGKFYLRYTLFLYLKIQHIIDVLYLKKNSSFLFFVDAHCHLSTEKKSRAKKLPLYYESSGRESNSLEQSGGGGGGDVNQLKL